MFCGLGFSYLPVLMQFKQVVSSLRQLSHPIACIILEPREFYQSEKLNTEFMLTRTLTIAIKISSVLKVLSLSISRIP